MVDVHRHRCRHRCLHWHRCLQRLYRCLVTTIAPCQVTTSSTCRGFGAVETWMDRAGVRAAPPRTSWPRWACSTWCAWLGRPVQGGSARQPWCWHPCCLCLKWGRRAVVGWWELSVEISTSTDGITCTTPTNTPSCMLIPLQVASCSSHTTTKPCGRRRCVFSPCGRLDSFLSANRCRTSCCC